MADNTQEKNYGGSRECLWIEVYRNGVTFEAGKPPKCIRCDGHGSVNDETNRLCNMYAAIRKNH